MPNNLKQLRNYLICVVVVLLFVPTILLAQSQFRIAEQVQFVSLLDSGLLDCHKASIQYIIWTEDESQLANIEGVLNDTGLSWQKYRLQDYYQNKAYKYSAQEEIPKGQEKDAVERYLFINKKVINPKTKVYFQETADAKINVKDYLQKYRVTNLEEVQAYNIVSVSGYCPGLTEGVKAGLRIINFEISARTNDSGEGKTVLALPALLEEF